MKCLTYVFERILSSALFDWFFGDMHGRDERDDDMVEMSGGFVGVAA